MGRRDGVQVILEVNARMRQIEPRIRITYESGWETRGNGQAANYEGGIVHHTTSYSSAAKPFPAQTVLRVGRPDLGGPLCNYAGPYCTTADPWLHVMSANPANHAGASGGRSMGPLPKTGLFNPRVLGLEIDYAGLVPMAAGQLYAAYIWSRAVADVLAGGNVEFIRAHGETSITGKWDPGYAEGKTIDMTAFRAAARTITAGAAGVGEDPNVKNLILGRVKGQSTTFVGDGVQRRWVADEKELKGLAWWIGAKGGDPKVYEFEDIRVLGVDVTNTPSKADLAHVRDQTLEAVNALPAGGVVSDGRPAPELDVKALAREVVAQLNQQARDGDPTTGPTT